MEKKFLIIFLILLSLLLLAGCTGNGISPGTGKNVSEKFLSDAHAVRSYSADVTRTYAGIENETDIFKIRVKYPDKLRIDFEKSEESGAGTIQILRKNTSYLYLPEENQMVEMPTD